VQKGDWVKCKGFERLGFVRRVAKDGSWADVDWNGWTKRMKTSVLQVVTEIPLHPHGAVTVRDLTRESETNQDKIS
jgi:hypothetical protein